MPVLNIKIANEFYSIQGEGHLVGTPMYFVRFAGCSVAECPLHPGNNGVCDTDWSVKKTDTIEAIADRALASGAKWVCITGGEPTDQNTAMIQLANAIRQNGQRPMLQTSGVRLLTDIWDWIAVSPKTPLDGLQQIIGHELKLIWNGQPDDVMTSLIDRTRFQKYFLQPLYQPNGTSNIREVADVVMRLGTKWRLGMQQHKVWGGE